MQTMTLSQIRSAGLAALVQSLGPVGMVRFLHQYESGEGDYTRERKQYIPKKTIDEIIFEQNQRNSLE